MPTAIADVPNLNDLERQHTVEAVRKYPGRKRDVARALGISLKTLYNRLERYGLDTDGKPLSQ